jgi:hypothetical protein
MEEKPSSRDSEPEHEFRSNGLFHCAYLFTATPVISAASPLILRALLLVPGSSSSNALHPDYVKWKFYLCLLSVLP